MVFGFSPYGAYGRVVRVEVDLRNGLPGTDIVGLASSEVREARERVRAAIRNSGYDYPGVRVLINLSPAAFPKVGAGFDLAIALAILERSGQVQLPLPMLASGELSIRGDVIPVRGTLSAVLSAADTAIRSIILASRAAPAIDASIVSDQTIYAVSTLRDMRDGLRRVVPSTALSSNGQKHIPVTFDDMRGQPQIKWASAIAAAGFHNLILMGPPGSGKTMAARRLVSLMPPMGSRENREVARLYSMRGLERIRIHGRPPVRMPHHSASLEGVLGGGKASQPGEVTLAHHGVLILDEATEFRPHVLQALREPVENHVVTITRAAVSEEYPARFQLVLTSNLCPCGKLGQDNKRCMCSVPEISRYWRRLGAALLDRVDIRIRTYYRQGDGETIRHSDLAGRVATAVARQEKRFAGTAVSRNGAVPPELIATLIPLSARLDELLRTRMHQLGLSDRATASVRRVARTIADLSDRDSIEPADILEAAALRRAGPE